VVIGRRGFLGVGLAAFFKPMEKLLPQIQMKLMVCGGVEIGNGMSFP
jgi:hypothetical protein